jgi:hypothetical protein
MRAFFGTSGPRPDSHNGWIPRRGRSSPPLSRIAVAPGCPLWFDRGVPRRRPACRRQSPWGAGPFRPLGPTSWHWCVRSSRSWRRRASSPASRRMRRPGTSNWPAMSAGYWASTPRAPPRATSYGTLVPYATILSRSATTGARHKQPWSSGPSSFGASAWSRSRRRRGSCAGGGSEPGFSESASAWAHRAGSLTVALRSTAGATANILTTR